jgi:cell division protein FtsL
LTAWPEARTTSTVLVRPRTWVPPADSPAPPATREKTAPVARSLPRALLRIFIRFELAISIIAIISLMIAASVIAHSALAARTGVHDTRIAVQRLENEIGFLEKELEDAKQSLENADSPENRRTLPIEPEDVASVDVPPLQ